MFGNVLVQSFGRDEAHTVNKLIKDYNSGLEEAIGKVEKHNAQVSIDMVSVGASASAIRRCFLPVPTRVPEINTKFLRRFLALFCWERRSLNTAGQYLEYSDPRLRSSRLKLHQQISEGVHRFLILNVDQVWRQSMRFGKNVYMKKHNRSLAFFKKNIYIYIHTYMHTYIHTFI